MTVPQPPERTGRVQPHVPATFLSGRANSQQDSTRWGCALAELTGPLSAPPGDATKWAGPPVQLPQSGGRSRLVRPGRPADTARTASPESPARAGRTAPPGPPSPEKTAPGDDEPPRPSKATTAQERVRTPPALDAEDRRRLLEGTHSDPHAHLGAHATAQGGVSFRTLRPNARSVTVITDGGRLRAELRDEGDGFFAGEVTVPDGGIPEYELLVRYGKRPGENDVQAPDPYGFPPALGEFDLRLIHEGRHEQLWRALGARTMTHHGVSGTRFTVWAPHARGVRVAGDFNRWDGAAHPMRSLGSADSPGVWELFLPGVGDGAVYKFEVVRDDGTRVLHADPMARASEAPPAGGSVVHTSTYRWHDGDWTDRRTASRPQAAPLSVYELHLPSWRPGLTYRELAAQLPPYVRDLGFTHVELMPCAEHSPGGSPDCQVTGLYTPGPRLGSPDDFKYLIDSLHRAGIGVIMDWVPEHLLSGEWAPPRNFLVANALYWCEEFHIDGLHMDSVTEMLYPGRARDRAPHSPDSPDSAANRDAVTLLQEVNNAVRRRCPGVITTAQESTAWDGVTRATHHEGESGFGGLGFSFTWNTGWLRGTLSYTAREPGQRTYHQEQLTASMAHAYSEDYILPVPHGEVAHGRRSLVSKMPGDWWHQRANHRACLGFMWAHPGKQLLFMGQEFAQPTEWSQEHGPDWWLLDPSYEAEADHRGVRDLVRDLNSEYVRNAALWQQDTQPGGFSWIEDGTSGASAAAGESVVAFLRYDSTGIPLLAVSNFSPVRRPGHRIGVPQARTSWREVLNTDDARYGGSGAGNPAPLPAEEHPAHGRPASIALTLPPLATIWLCPVSSLSACS